MNPFFSGDDVTMVASMLKLKAGRLAREITDSCLQYWGGMGFTNDVYVSRYDLLLSLKMKALRVEPSYPYL